MLTSPREDTAKYLRNLNPESAYYDPKSRSMRDNPTPHIKDAVYAGDNFVRASGEVTKFAQFQAYTYKAYETGQEIHMNAVPSQAELLFKSFKDQTEQTSKQNKESILQKYGGHEQLDAKSLMLGQTEEYVEYRYDGSIIRGKESGIPKSKYEEDVMVNNHKSIWGSYYEDGQWGYCCCRNLVKNSYCTGKAGITAKEAMNRTTTSKQEEPVPNGFKEPEKKTEKKDVPQIRFEKGGTEGEEKDERKRAYNSTRDYEVSPEEMEAYQQKKKRSEDPMAAFL